MANEFEYEISQTFQVQQFEPLSVRMRQVWSDGDTDSHIEELESLFFDRVGAVLETIKEMQDDE